MVDTWVVGIGTLGHAATVIATTVIVTTVDHADTVFTELAQLAIRIQSALGSIALDANTILADGPRATSGVIDAAILEFIGVIGTIDKAIAIPIALDARCPIRTGELLVVTLDVRWVDTHHIQATDLPIFTVSVHLAVAITAVGHTLVVLTDFTKLAARIIDTPGITPLIDTIAILTNETEFTIRIHLARLASAGINTDIVLADQARVTIDIKITGVGIWVDTLVFLADLTRVTIGIYITDDTDVFRLVFIVGAITDLIADPFAIDAGVIVTLELTVTT